MREYIKDFIVVTIKPRAVGRAVKVVPGQFTSVVRRMTSGDQNCPEALPMGAPKLSKSPPCPRATRGAPVRATAQFQ